jgi:nicotinate-nucleotide--dimethylbenzimidazole phosphoribosyltransferase
VAARVAAAARGAFAPVVPGEGQEARAIATRIGAHLDRRPLRARVGWSRARPGAAAPAAIAAGDLREAEDRALEAIVRAAVARAAGIAVAGVEVLVRASVVHRVPVSELRAVGPGRVAVVARVEVVGQAADAAQVASAVGQAADAAQVASVAGQAADAAQVASVAGQAADVAQVASVAGQAVDAAQAVADTAVAAHAVPVAVVVPVVAGDPVATRRGGRLPSPVRR